MKYEKINTGIIVNEIEEEPIEIVDHSIIGLMIDEGGKHADVYNMLSTNETIPGDDGEDSEIPLYIGIKTRFNIENEDDTKYLKSIPINIDNMDEDIAKKASSIMSSIYPLDSYYSDIVPVEWKEDTDKHNDEVKVVIKGYHIVTKDNVTKTYNRKFILPLGTYIMLAKIKSDLVCNIEINSYYTFSSKDFKYVTKDITGIEYIGSELAGKEDNGLTKILSMYNITGDGIDEYITVPFSMNAKVNIHKEKTLKEFAEEHDTFFNFDVRAFLYYETDDKGDTTPAMLIYSNQDKTYMIYKFSDKVMTKLFEPDKEVR